MFNLVTENLFIIDTKGLEYHPYSCELVCGILNFSLGVCEIFAIDFEILSFAKALAIQ